jgi:glycosyltransferase involved in cell wall biosynthesis
MTRYAIAMPDPERGQSPAGARNSKPCVEAKALGRRALFVLPSDSMGGAERLTIALIEAAASNGLFFEVDVFIFAKPPSGSLERLKLLPNVNIICANARREPGAVIKFMRFLSHRKFEFVFSTHTHINSVCCLMRSALILKTNRLITRESTSIFEFDVGKFNVIIPYLVRLYGNQDLLVHQTEHMRSSFNRHTKGRLRAKSRVVPNPVDLFGIERDARAPLPKSFKVPDQTTKIVWCGRLIDCKQPLLAIETMQRLAEHGADHFRLAIIGDGPLMQSSREVAAQFGLSDRITFCGYLDNPWPVMSRCDLGLLTSNIEGFPNVILEMLACGVRGVVTTNCAGDLGGVPGVHVSKEPNGEALAALLVKAAARPRPVNMDQFLRRRSPEAFLQNILSDEGQPSLCED